jgi:hypothetical protein
VPQAVAQIDQDLFHDDMTREEVLNLMYHASTLEECKRAWEARAVWLNGHPDDEAIIEESEGLYMREQALTRIALPQAQTERVA